jgi:hypothetical protein
MYGCAVGPKKALHGFSYDAVFEMENVEIVDLRYGSGPSFPPRTRCVPVREDGAKCIQRMAATLLPEVAETLWVKWKLKSSGEVFEDTISLTKWHPYISDGMNIFFVIREKQLSLYLDTRQPRPAGWPRYPNVRQDYFKVYQLYPTSNLDKQ